MADMSGKTVLVTGATSGIGRVMARELAKAGARVGIVARDPARGEAARDELRRESGNEKVELFLCDFASQKSIRALARDVDARFDRLHVLVNNAGAVHSRRQTSADGLELTFAVNHLGYFLLTNLLLPKLRASAPSRIVSTASAAHLGQRLDFEDLQASNGYGSFRAYGRSKLANILFTRELARRLEGSQVTANCFHPGVVRSGFAKNSGALLAFGAKVGGLFMISPEKGAETGVWLATAPELDGVTGKYFAKRREARSSGAAKDDAAAKRLWDESEKLVSATA
ncbi:MAG: SDR family oxidoreductase [Deltaproteobacteria bacterium]